MRIIFEKHRLRRRQSTELFYWSEDIQNECKLQFFSANYRKMKPFLVFQLKEDAFEPVMEVIELNKSSPMYERLRQHCETIVTDSKGLPVRENHPNLMWSPSIKMKIIQLFKECQCSMTWTSKVRRFSPDIYCHWRTLPEAFSETWIQQMN